MTATSSSTTATEEPPPLTTIFTPPSECLTDLWMLKSSFSNGVSNWGHLGPADPRRCLPSGWSPQSYFSPGISCPSGWTSDGATVKGDETTATCCPIYEKSSWTFTPRGPTSIDRAWHSFEICVYGVKSTVEYTALNTNKDGISVDTEISTQTPGQGWNAYGIELRWQATDSKSAPATSSVSINSASSASTTSPSDSSGSSGLSTGAKAGLGVGVSIGGLLIILAMALVIFRECRRSREATRTPTNGPLIVEEHYELGAKNSNLHESGANPVFEKDGCRDSQPRLRNPVELDG